MATLHWLNGAGGSWDVATNWDLGSVPLASDIALIDAPGSYSVTITAADAVQSLILNDAGATVVDTGSLALTGALTATAGTFDLAAGGVVSGGTLSATGGSFAWNGGTLSGATYQGALDLTAAGASLSIANGLTATGTGGVGPGTINADGTATSLTFLGTQTIDNVTINAGNLAGTGGTALNFGDLTLGAHATLNQVGGGGVAGFASWATYTGTSLTNNGTIQASLPTGGAHIVTTTFVNNGLMSAVPGAAFDILATNMTNNGTVTGDIPVSTSGTLTNNGVFTSTGGASPTTFVNNGVFNDAGGFATSPGGWLNNGTFNLGSSTTQSYLALVGGSAAPVPGVSLGTLNLVGVGTQLRLLGSQSWQSGTINVGGTAQQITESAQYPIVGATSQLILGAQTVMNHTAGASTFNTGQLTLDGNINASAAGGLFTLASGSLVDNGAINVSGGDHLTVSDAVTGSGKITLASGGIAEFSSSVASTDATVFTDASNATLRLDLGNANNFKSVIQGFTNGNTIDLAGVTATGATWANGVLTIAGSGWGTTGPITLAMAGNYAGATFHVASDGILASPANYSFFFYTGSNITVTGAGTPPPPRFYGGAGATLSAAEGSAVNAPVASFTDSNSADTASQLSATIAWGDGTTSAGIVTGGAGVFSVAPAAGHIYADEGSYATSIAITNSADNVTTTLAGGATATEADVLTPGAAPAIAATAGTAFNGTVATFTDSYTANTASDFAATINWGDGTSSAGTITDVNGVLSVAGSHTFGATGNDVLSVTLNDTHGTAAATATGNATVTAPTVNAATGLTVLSVSDAGVSASGVAPPLTIHSSSATETTIPGTVSASSSAVAYSGTASVNTAQTVTAGWTSSTAGTATFADTWSATAVTPGVYNAEQSYGLQGGPDYANATFTVSMAAAGSFNIAWTATETGTGPTNSWGTTSGPAGEFGLMNMVVSIDGGAAMQVANASVLSPSGSFTGALSAGAHTIKVMDWSNYSGANTNSSGSLTETLNLAINQGAAPPPPPPPRVYGGVGATMSAAEGSTIPAPVASFTDSNAADTASQLSATIVWGDGTTSAGTVSGGNGVFSVTDSTGHVYAAEGSHATSIAITNGADAVTTTLTGSVTSIDADVLTAGTPPAISATAGLAISGTVATFTDSYTANTASDLTATIAWGDGTTSTGTVTDVNGAISVAGAHTYAAAGTDAVSVVLKEVDGTATATASGSATVVTPYAGSGSAVAATEGTAFSGPVATFTDANAADTASAFTATIAWGDGTTSAGTVSGANGAFSVSGATGHVYATEGSYAVATTVIHTADNAQLALAGSATAAEADVLTVGAAPAITATAGLAFNGTVATFTDSYTANTASDLTATIAWGDGTTSVGTVTDVNGAISVAGAHTYAAAGTDAVSVVLKEVDGTATATASGSATVATPYAGSGSTVAATEGTAFTGPVAAFTDANAADTASAFTATIAWGDGTTSAGTVTGANGAFSVSGGAGHVYATEGSHAVATTVTHTVDNAQLALAGSVTVAEADAFTAGTAPVIGATAGKAFSGTVATFTDSYTANTASDLTATIAWGDGTTSVGTVTDVNGAISVAGAHTYAAAGSDAVSVTLTDKDGTASATASGTATVAAVVPVVTPPGTYVLTTKQDDLTGGAGNNTFVAATNTLSNGDVIRGGTGVNTLQLVGGGTFDLGIVDTLSKIQIVSAQEGAGAAAQVVTLRENTAYTVNVASGPAGSGILIIGAQNHDIINLGSGNDTVVMDVGETANGGGGNAVYKVNQDSIFDTINGGTTGTNTLVITVGGDQIMGSNITGMTAVQLTAKTNFTANTTANMQISGSAAGGDTIVLGAASQSVVSGGANEKIRVTAANAGAQVSGVGANSTLEITTGGTAVLNANTSIGTVKLDAATNLMLSKMSFVTAVGSSGADTITAGATYQTLTGGGGADTLIGYAGGYDTFSDKASGLNGDMIRNFVATDRIDVTDLSFAGAVLKVTASGANTLVTLTSGATKSTFSMAGSLSAAGFHLASDGVTGSLLTHS